jgi:hypothetical protein
MTTHDEIERRPRRVRAALCRRFALRAALGAAGAIGSALVQWLWWWVRGR